MANKLILKRSSVAAKVPLAADLEVGEIAVNLADQKLYSKNSSGTVILVGSGTGGTGDVVGPASATDNAIARFDTTSGKLIQNSAVTLDDAGAMTGVTIDSYLNDVGADHIHYKIKAMEAISKGQLVKYSGWNAGENAVEVYKVSSATDVAIGMSDSSLATGEFGLAVVNGAVEGFDTSAFTEGTILYPNTTGGLTATKPSSGMYQACALVLRSQSVNGAVLVNFAGPEYVEASTNTGNTTVLRDSSGNFSAGTITAALSGNATTATTLATGRTIAMTGDVSYTSGSFNGSANVTGTATLANSGVTAGSYTNASVTVDAKGRVTSASSGTAPVTSVTGTSPVVSSGGTTPAISLASGYGDTQNPYASKTAKYFLAAPNAAAGAPTFRAIVASDIPTLNQNTTGSAAKWTTARTLSFTGDATGSGSVDGSANVATALTLANTAVTAGSYTNASVTVDSKGRITAASSGTAPVTSVGATAPIASSGGATPTISISQASGTTNGYLSSTDWTTFNNKTSNTGTVTSVATSGAITGGTITTSGTISHLTSDGYLHVPATGTTNNGKVLTAGATAGSLSWTTPTTGTVTSVSGTGSYGGLTLSGTVTSSGNLTLGGTPTGTWPISVSGSSASTTGNAATATTLATARTINGTSFNGSANITTANWGTARTINGTSINGSTNYTIPVNTSQKSDSVAYQIPFVSSVTAGNQNLYTDSAANITYNPSTNTLTTTTFSGALSGNATTATTLQTARTINGTSFNGSANITTANWGTARTLSFTGDVTGSASVNGSANVATAMTLANSGVTANTYGSSSAIPVLTVDAKGRVTGATTAAVAGGQYLGTAAVKAIAYNAQTIAENITIGATQNGLSAGPITINTGYTVTVSTGGNWSIV